MMRRLGVFGSAGALLASALVAVVTLGASAAHADPFEDWDMVSAGYAHACGIRHGGKLYCWGDSSWGKVGDPGADNPQRTPKRIGSFEDWATVSAGYAQTCGIRKNGKLYCWGDQSTDGNLDHITSTAVPVRVGTFEDWDAVSAGGNHTCGIRHGGKLYCWGENFCGEIGDGWDAPCFEDGFENVASPRRIGTFEDWSTVAAGGGHTCGVRTNGKLYCWGKDSDGQVGDGSPFTPTTSPRRIGSFEDWADVSAGYTHTCGVRKNGKLYCWGKDTRGQVGDGDAAFAAITPRRIGTFEDWANVAAGGEHTCGVRENGKLYCWGDDSKGQIGDGLNFGSPDPAISPRRIGTFEDWTSVSAGFQYTCGIRHGGRLYCWGDDSDGQVGNGDSGLSTAVPRQI